MHTIKNVLYQETEIDHQDNKFWYLFTLYQELHLVLSHTS